MTSKTNQKITELENTVTNLRDENNMLKRQISSLEQSFMNLESEYSKVKTMYSSIASKEGSLKVIQSKLNEKEELIQKLQKELEKEMLKHQKYKLDYDLQYEKDVNQAKYIHENNLAKIENANRIEKLCKSLYEINIKYEKIIQTFEEEEKKRVQERQVEFEKRMSDMKKKMLDYIKNGQKSGSVFNANQKDLNTKLSILHNNQLLSELEFQSLQIEDLLKQREHLDKVILELKNDIKIHTEIEKVLGMKNKKYTNMIKVLGNKLDELNANNTLNEKISVNSNKTISNFDVSHNNKFLLHSSNSTGKIISAQREILSKQKTIENYKLKYDSIKSKYDTIIIRFSSIIENIELVLEKIYNDPLFPKMKELYANIEDFKKCDFDLLPPDQKYAATVMIIKYILPIVQKEVIESSAGKDDVNGKTEFYKKFDNIKTKFFFSKDDSTKTFTSLGGESRTNKSSKSYYLVNSQNSMKHLRYKSVSDFKRGNMGSISRIDINKKSLNLVSFEGDKNKQKLYSLLKINP